MHELSLCQHIINIVITHSTKFEYKRVIGIYLEIGMLTYVEKSALLFNFDVLKKQTIVEHATLHFIDIPGEAFCDSCQKKIEISQYNDSCPYCGQFLLKIIKGLELRVKSLEVA